MSDRSAAGFSASAESAYPRPAYFDYDERNVILSVVDLRKEFRVRRQAAGLGQAARAVVKAVDGVSFQLRRGEILGLVGESGCGKTTTGKMIMKLLEPTGGRIIIDGKDETKPERNEAIAYRRSVQMVFQDPYASMNPRFKVRDVLEEPLLIHKIGETRKERISRVVQVMEKVKMTPVDDYLDRYPHMLSGGQRQRIATARTLILSPRIIVADEPVSMIDLSTRAEILAMMKAVQQDMELSFLYITHDLSTARYFTDRIAVMYLGRIVEIGSSDDVIDSPAHPYTKALISAVCEPIAGAVDKFKELLISGEIPSPANIPPGCRFHPRCPARMEICDKREPSMSRIGNEHYAACWLHSREN